VAHVYGAAGGERDFSVGGDEDGGGGVLGDVEWCYGGPLGCGFCGRTGLRGIRGLGLGGLGLLEETDSCGVNGNHIAWG
jgi:hypothetical protein